MAPRRSSPAAVAEEVSSSDDSSEYTPPSSPKPATRHRRPTGPRPHHPHILTRHHYEDHAADPVLDAEGCASDSGNSHHGQGKGGVTMAFPVKLYEMLIQVENEGLDHIVSWQPHGRCFVVHEPKAFKELLPQYFKLSKIASFQRQLNLYGFQRLTVGPDKNSYYNSLFLRGRIDLACRIQRVKVKGTGVRAKANPAEEPNLYQYPPVDSLAAEAKGKYTQTEIVVETKKPRNKQKPTPKATIPSLPQALPMPTMIPREVVSKTVTMEHHNHKLKASSAMEWSLIDVTSPEAAKVEGEVNFDRLIDAMFSSQQTLDFADLLKLAAV